MSLSTDRLFYAVLSQDERVYASVQGRIFNTAIDGVQEGERDNTPLPYLVILNNGTTNDAEHKDTGFEGDTDTDRIGVMVVADTRRQLAELAETVRQVVRTTIAQQSRDMEADTGIALEDYAFAAAEVQYDDQKPCYWQTLSYQCTTHYTNYGNY